MKLSPLRSSSVTLLAALALGVTGCSEDNGGAERIGQSMGRKMDQGTETAKEKLEQSSDAVQQKLDQAGNSVADAAIAARIKAKILQDPGLKIAQISVDTHDGVVVLTGTVNTPDDATRAVQLAQSVESVKSVDNRLSIRSNG